MREQSPSYDGAGVKRPRRSAPVEPKTEQVLLDQPPVWVDLPVLKDQIKNKDLWRPKGLKVENLDLSKPEDMLRYSTLKAIAASGEGNEFIIQEDRQFSRKTDNWRVLVMIQIVEFRQVLKSSNN